MPSINIDCDNLVSRLLSLSKRNRVCFLDSCGINNLGSHLLICGINPIRSVEMTDANPDRVLEFLDETISNKSFASIFTISYDFGLKLEGLTTQMPMSNEPDFFLAIFDNLIIHDYNTKQTRLVGNEKKFREIEDLLALEPNAISDTHSESSVRSSETRASYAEKILLIQELIRRGDTYQVTLTQHLTVDLGESLSPQVICQNLQTNNPTPFSAFLTRENDHVISTSPERFFRVDNNKISVSPIKGTRPRGTNLIEDDLLRKELISSEKDNAENIMIVDLMRNDLGRICEYGSINVEKVCELEIHPSLFHLVSTVSGKLRKGVKPSQIIRALFPCGSITGCPKIRTMEIIDEIEKASRGLSMGTIGYSDFDGNVDLSVAIRTMVIREGKAVFNVGGGIVIDSDPQAEYEESLTKAKALLDAIHGKLVSK